MMQERRTILDLLRKISRLGGVDSKARQLKTKLGLDAGSYSSIDAPVPTLPR
jgi:hypothetical protein